jgi:Scavenger mRNA decapping enzyme C-term binding
MEQPTVFGNLDGNALNKFKKLTGLGTVWLEEPVKKGTKYYKDQRAEFQALGKQGLADKFRASQPMSDVDADVISGLVGMKKPPIPAFEGPPMAPVFTWLYDNNKPHLYQDNDFTLFLNASFPYISQYPPDKATASGMSLVHMLACPNERVYNAVSLLPSDVPLIQRMKAKVEELMDQDYNPNDPTNFKNICLTALDEKMTGKVPSDLTDEYAKDKEAFKNTKGSQMRFYFHIHPNHSVGHLHMHCLQNNLRTSYLHEHKNAKYDDIVKVLTGEAQPALQG